MKDSVGEALSLIMKINKVPGLIADNKTEKEVFSFEEKSITTDGFVLTEGINTWNNTHTKHKTLALFDPWREEFKKSHPRVFSLLRREILNPILEEGVIKSNEQREHKGEFFLTHEAIALLVKHKIIDNPSPKYDKSNIFVLHEDKHDFAALLDSLSLDKHGKSAKIIHIISVHARALYLRNIHGTIYGLFIDSQPLTNDIPTLVKDCSQALPGSMMFYNTAQLQVDHFSCATFAIKCLMYFSKHGEEVFNAINKQHYLEKKEKNIYALLPNILPAPLWKLTQRTQPDKVFLEEIVSENKKMNLENYLKNHLTLFLNHHYNLSAIRKKYHYIDQLEKFLEAQLRDHDSTFTKQLPPELQSIVDNLGGTGIKRYPTSSENHTHQHCL